jgi:hypothetical protein
MGLTISIDFVCSLNNSLILESVKDQVIVSRYPFDARALCKK